ncbi:sigma-70 family RNA polymerase sigma factor [Lachnospiraceae bacterium 45-W7]
MAYNKAREERKWRIWKEAEEKELRGLGVSEDKITKLHEYDWSVFKSDRRYYEKLRDAGTYLEEMAETERAVIAKSVEDFLDSIENERLYQVLVTVDRLTLQIVLWKMGGYSSPEISEKCGLSVNAVNFRIWHLKKKIKNIL